MPVVDADGALAWAVALVPTTASSFGGFSPLPVSAVGVSPLRGGTAIAVGGFGIPFKLSYASGSTGPNMGVGPNAILDSMFASKLYALVVGVSLLDGSYVWHSTVAADGLVMRRSHVGDGYVFTSGETSGLSVSGYHGGDQSSQVVTFPSGGTRSYVPSTVAVLFVSRPSLTAPRSVRLMEQLCGRRERRHWKDGVGFPLAA